MESMECLLCFWRFEQDEAGLGEWSYGWSQNLTVLQRFEAFVLLGVRWLRNLVLAKVQLGFDRTKSLHVLALEFGYLVAFGHLQIFADVVSPLSKDLALVAGPVGVLEAGPRIATAARQNFLVA